MNKTARSLFLFLLCIAGRLNAQTGVYHPMPDSNAAWCETASYGVVCGITERKILQVNGDTSIGSVVYHKLTATGYANCVTQYSYFTNEYRGAYRQDTAARKVYMVDANTTNEYLLYDFTLGIGDTTPENTGPGITITSIDSVLVGANFHRRYWGTNSMMNDSVNIVEGVGSSCGFYLMQYQGVEYFSQLNSYFENSVEIFVPDSQSVCQLIMHDATIDPASIPEVEVYPNPASEEFTISYFGRQQHDVTLELIDISGRVLQSTEYAEVLSFSQVVGDELLAEGLYFIRITSGEEVVTKKVMVQK